EHPLHEVLADHGPGVLDAVVRGDHRDVRLGGDGGDAVDHAVGEGDVGGDPVADGRVAVQAVLVAAACVGEDHALGEVPVAAHVVAGHDGEGGGAGLAASAQRLDHVAEHGAG